MDHKRLCLDVHDRQMLNPTGDPIEDKVMCLRIKTKSEQAVVLSIQERARAQGFRVPEVCPDVDDQLRIVSGFLSCVKTK